MSRPSATAARSCGSTGRRYRVTLTRDDDPTLVDFARPEVERKYGAPPPGEGGALFFRLTSRS